MTGHMKSDGVSRRALVAALGWGLVAIGFLRTRATAAVAEGPVTVETFSDAGQDEGPRTLPRVVRTDDDWRSRLAPGDYDVTRRAGTERPYTGRTWNQHADGLYRCICCETALFTAATKFESGTGWPSFWQPIAAGNIVAHQDRSFGFTRTEVACVRCDAHLGHVFTDGPKPTGLRYCMNSAALRFVPKAST